MGSCFSSSSEDAAGYGYGVEKQRIKVWPSDEDGRWPYVGERDVDNKASVFIANFHRHQSGACEEGCPDHQAPAPAAA